MKNAHRQKPGSLALHCSVTKTLDSSLQTPAKSYYKNPSPAEDDISNTLIPYLLFHLYLVPVHNTVTLPCYLLHFTAYLLFLLRATINSLPFCYTSPSLITLLNFCIYG